MIRRDENEKTLETDGGKAVAATEKKVLRETAEKESLSAGTEKRSEMRKENELERHHGKRRRNAR
jgi:hypothetical protein